MANWSCLVGEGRAPSGISNLTTLDVSGFEIIMYKYLIRDPHRVEG